MSMDDYCRWALRQSLERDIVAALGVTRIVAITISNVIFLIIINPYLEGPLDSASRYEKGREQIILRTWTKHLHLLLTNAFEI